MDFKIWYQEKTRKVLRNVTFQRPKRHTETTLVIPLFLATLGVCPSLCQLPKSHRKDTSSLSSLLSLQRSVYRPLETCQPEKSLCFMALKVWGYCLIGPSRD